MNNKDIINNKILIGNIQAENGNGNRKWKLLRTQFEEMLYKYKFPKIIHLGINATEASQKRKEFENFLSLNNLTTHKAADWTWEQRTKSGKIIRSNNDIIVTEGIPK